jgi:hypothetical protein
MMKLINNLGVQKQCRGEKVKPEILAASLKVPDAS